jgi:hypothetical protein
MALPNIRFQPFVEVSAVYDTGLANVGVNDQGQLATTASAGVAVNWGVSGAHSWRHDKIGLSYRGGLTHYTHNTANDTIDQSLLFSLTHQFSRHMTLDFRESAAYISRDFGILNLPQTVSFDPSTAYIPTTDFFDNRTYYLNTHASFILQKTNRLSFRMAGDSIEIRRRSNALNGTRGYTASGDVQYRLTRRSTIGANYTYMHFEYTKLFGATDAHQAVGTYAIRLTRWTEFSGFAGVVRVESKFIQQVAVDPVIAAILGISSAAQVAHTIRYIPDVGLRLSRTFRTGVLYAGATRSVTPGNGLFVTSYGSSVSGGYAYTGRRRWSFGASGDYTWAYSAGTITGKYNGLGIALNASRQIVRSLHLTTGTWVRRYGSPNFNQYNRTIYEARIGIAFAPGEVPLRIW